MLDPATGALVKSPTKLAGLVRYYHYSVAYVPAVDRFLVLGTSDSGGGFGYLLDSSGNVTATNTSLPPIVRESESIVRGNRVVQATWPNGLMALSLTGSSITLDETIADAYNWQYMGTD